MTPDDPLVGRLIGPYVIQSLLGAGGMGRVYRARDSKLERDVAIKVLPDAVAADPERVARFAREARVLASLNHPNIAAIYGFEHASSLQGLVLELVEGETLADRLRAGPIPLDEALTIARQIADALNAAHEKGIIHRDLKPANVIIQSGRDTKVKILDFGLAKVAQEDAADLTRAPTATFGGTRDGAVMGTTAYMSPEQARGQALDQRTDIWSFGCVVYEMLTGRMAFKANTGSDTIVAILGRDPDWNALPKMTPPAVCRLLERCLEKNASLRIGDIDGIRRELDRVIAQGPAEAGHHVLSSARSELSGFNRAVSKLPRWSLLPIAIALVLVGIAGIVWGVRPHLSAPPRAAATPLEPPVQLTNFNDSVLAPALSADGRYLAFIRGGSFGTSSFPGEVWVKMLPEGAAVQLTHDAFNKESPTFSPDGSRIVYTSVINSFKWDSWHVPVLGGAPALFLANASGLTWADAKELVYSEIVEGINMGLTASGANGLGRRRIYLPNGAGAMAHRSALSPDRKSLLAVEMDGVGWLPCRLLPFDGSSVGHPVGPPDGQCTTVAWSPDGRWMYFSSDSGGALHVWRQQYPNGTPERITAGATEEEGTAVTPDGKYIVTSMGLEQATVWLHDSHGNRQLTSEGFAILPTISPAGDRVYYLMHDRATRAYVSGELWSMDLATGQQEPALPGQVMAQYSISRDGKTVLFISTGARGGDGVWIADLDRRTPPRQLTKNAEYRAMFGAPGEIIYMSQHDNVQHIFRMKEDGSGSVQVSPEPVIHLINVSPDGRWAAVTGPIERNVDGSKVMLLSTRGDPPYLVCDHGCSLGFGPARIEAPMLAWDAEGTSLFVTLKRYGLHTMQTVVLPYRSGTALEALWPKGLTTQQNVLANPGARVIAEGDAFPGSSASSYLFWKRVSVSNIYRLPLPR